MRRMLIGGFVTAFTLAAALGWAAKGDPAKGKASFDQMCVSCHGPSGKGDGPVAAALSPKPADLTNKALVASLKDDFLKKLIKEGGKAVGMSPLMPPLGAALKDGDIDNVISYVRSLGK